MLYNKHVNGQDITNIAKSHANRTRKSNINTYEKSPSTRQPATEYLDYLNRDHQLFRSLVNTEIFQLSNAMEPIAWSCLCVSHDNIAKCKNEYGLSSIKVTIPLIIIPTQTRQKIKEDSLQSTGFREICTRSNEKFVVKKPCDSLRIQAGSDNCGRKCMSEGQNCCPSKNGQNANNQGTTIWGQNNGCDAPRRQPYAKGPSKIPVPCRRSDKPRRQDRPVQHYHGSRLPVPIRPGPTPARIPRSGRTNCYNQGPPTQPRGSSACCNQGPSLRPRASSCFNERAPLQSGGSGCCNRMSPSSDAARQRSCSRDVPEPANLTQCIRRSTYNVPQPAERQMTSAGRPNNGGGGMTGTFTMTGTIRMENGNGCVGGGTGGIYFQEVCPCAQQACMAPAPAPAQAPCIPDANETIEDFLDNHMNFDTVAPRSLAVPGCPYVPIEGASSPGTTPEQWRHVLDNRSSLGSDPLTIDVSPPYDNNGGEFDTPVNFLAPESVFGRDTRPFGLDDSFIISSPCNQSNGCRSRAVSMDRNRHGACPNRRRDTFDRNTR